MKSLERDVQLFGKLSRRYAEDLEVLPTYYVDEDGVHDVEKHAEQLRVRDAMIADGNSWLADEQRAVVALAEGMTTAEGARAELSGFISRYPYRVVGGSLPAGCRLGATF